MKKLAQRLQKFLKAEDGPTAVEYAVMLALIIVVCLVSIRLIGQTTNSTFDHVGQQVNTVVSP